MKKRAVTNNFIQVFGKKISTIMISLHSFIFSDSLEHYLKNSEIQDEERENLLKAIARCLNSTNTP
jgi:hypothetical protein